MACFLFMKLLAPPSSQMNVPAPACESSYIKRRGNLGLKLSARPSKLRCRLCYHVHSEVAAQHPR